MDKLEKQALITLWKQNSPEAFLSWCSWIKPKIKTDDGYQYVTFTPKQLEIIDNILKPAVNTIPTPTTQKAQPIIKRSRQLNSRKARPGKRKSIKEDPTELMQTRESVWKHSMSLVIQPRRHGKSNIMRLIVLWLCSTRTNFTCQLLGSTESSTSRIIFKPLKQIILHTPALLKLWPEKQHYVFEIFSIPALGNTIQMSPGNNPATSFGSQLDIIFCDDVHSFPDMDVFENFLSSTLDSSQSLILMASNADEVGGQVHLIEQAAKEDDTIFCDYTFYGNFSDYAANAPPWIDRKKAAREERIKLPTAFLRDILGQRADSASALFSAKHIEQCRSPFKWPVDDVEAITSGRRRFIGGGLDRSKSLMGSKLSGKDNTIWTVTAKVANPKNEEPEYIILEQTNIIPNIASNIKRIILNSHKKFKLDNVVLEDYETLDLMPYLESQKIPCELVSAHSTRQNQIMPELHRMVKENRLFFPEDADKLISELTSFNYRQAKRGEGFSFGHAHRNQLDDRIYSLAWSVYALRKQVLTLYAIESIVCQSKHRNRHMCYLMGGDLELFCSESCPASKEAKELHKNFLAYQMADSDMLVTEFFKEFVKVTGSRISQR